MNGSKALGLTLGVLIAIVVAVLAAVLVETQGDADEDWGNPDIRGEITSISGMSVLIEGEIEADTSYDKASVRVEDGTDIYITEADGSLSRAAFDDLEEGQTVEAWFEGPVAESYPVQAKAGRIVVLSES